MSLPRPSRITAQDFYDYHKCPHRVFLNRHGDPGERLPHSEFLDLLFDNALAHERDVVKELQCDVPAGEGIAERAIATLELMTKGAGLIYQGVLLLADESGIPDLLEKVPGTSKFGDFYYRPVDIKAGSGYANQKTKKLRNDYGMQLFHYGQLLAAIQGRFPAQAAILNKSRTRIPYPLARFASDYSQAKNRIRELIEGRETDEPARCGECGTCQWWGQCEKRLVAIDDVTLLPDVGRSKKVVLQKAGVRSIKDLANFDFAKVRLKGIATKTAESLKESAACLLSNEIRMLKSPVIRNPPRKIYLDFEDDPMQDLIYLCGMWIEPAIRGRNYHGLFCTDEIGEAKIWKDFQGLCEALGPEDFVVFHYSKYEKTKLAVLEKKYGTTNEPALENFKKRMVDLLPIVKKSVILPSRGYGLKKVAPFVGLKYSAANAGGAQSIVWFQKYQENPRDTEVMKVLLTYNQEDCLNMKYLEEWLRISPFVDHRK